MQFNCNETATQHPSRQHSNLSQLQRNAAFGLLSGADIINHRPPKRRYVIKQHMRRTFLLGAVLLHAASALHVSKLQRRHVLKGCGLAIASPLIAHADDEPAAADAPVVEEAPPPPPAKTSAIDDARDRAKRYAEFSKTLRRTYDKNDLNAAYAEMVSFEKELARIAPTKEAAEGAKELKQVLRGLVRAAKRDDRRVAQKKVGGCRRGRIWPTLAVRKKRRRCGTSSSRQAPERLTAGAGLRAVRGLTYAP